MTNEHPPRAGFIQAGPHFREFLWQFSGTPQEHFKYYPTMLMISWAVSLATLQMMIIGIYYTSITLVLTNNVSIPKAHNYKPNLPSLPVCRVVYPFFTTSTRLPVFFNFYPFCELRFTFFIFFFYFFFFIFFLEICELINHFSSYRP